jgi:hypothetical protein
MLSIRTVPGDLGKRMKGVIDAVAIYQTIKSIYSRWP